MKRNLKSVFAWFVGRCYMPEAVIEEQPAEKVEEIKAEAPAEEAQPEAPYYGSKELNPDGRPLNLDVSGLSRADIDEILRTEGPEIFMTDEQIKARAAKAAAEKKPEDKKTDEKKPDEKEPDGKKAEDEKKPEEDPAKKFLETSGLTQEEFSGLSESAQEKLVDKFIAASEAEEKLGAVEKEYTQFKTDTETVLRDPVIAARVAEMETGKRFVAKELAPLTDAEFDEIDRLLASEKREEAKARLNQAIKERAEAAVSIERGVADRQKFEAESRKGVEDTWKKIGDLDPRFKLDESDLSKLRPGHKEWEKFEKGPLGELKQYCVKKGMTMQDVIKMGPKELHAAFCAHKGWDREKENKIYEKGKADLLKSLRTPKQVARTLDQGTRSGGPGSHANAAGFDREALLEDLVKNEGRSAQYDRLLERFDGNDAVQRQLFGVFEQAQKAIALSKAKR